jgi:ubiquinone/menaquinone biosynthesis C-methylase UbiE
MENIKEHLQWWENNLSSNELEKEFEGWLENSDYDSRKKLFLIIQQRAINNVLELGPGTFIDYQMFFSKEKNISYHSIDITKKIVDNGKKMGIECSQGSIEQIKYPDSHFNLVYCRHVFEHLDYYTQALSEMIRVSNKYVAVIFWLINDGDFDSINYDSNVKLYHNRYSKTKIETFLTEQNLKFNWVYCSNDIILFIEK